MAAEAKFQFGTGSNESIIYQIENTSTKYDYCSCLQITGNNLSDWPMHIYLNLNQLKHTLPFMDILPKNTTFQMGQSSVIYKITSINEQHRYYECIADNTQNCIYLNLEQMQFVKIINNDHSKNGIYSLGNEEETEEYFAHLSSILPYFADFMQRKEDSVLNQNDFKDDPHGYLEAILKKYNILHPRSFDDENTESEYDKLRPWIEGKMQKLMAESGYFGTEKWKTRLFRLFDEALVWFDDEPSFLKKLFYKNDDSKENELECMRPFGVLPLAMITGLKTCDLSSENVQLSENELLRLELEIGDEGIIILKCSDVNQRIKWYECLHSAIFAVKRPLFTKDKDLWRISEPKAADNKNNKTTKFRRQITKEDVMSNDEWRKKAMHVRMGKSLAFKLNDFKIGTRGDNEVQIELQNTSDIGDFDDMRVPSLSNDDNSGKSVNIL